MTSCDVTWRNMTSHDVIFHVLVFLGWSLSMHNNYMKKIQFFQTHDLELWPTTLTIKLIQDIVKVHPCTKYWFCRSNCSVVRVLTDTHTHSITLTASLRREVIMLYSPILFCFPGCSLFLIPSMPAATVAATTRYGLHAPLHKRFSI